MKIGYIRVCTEEQEHSSAGSPLRELDVDELFIDKGKR